jgi:hypothetical protein
MALHENLGSLARETIDEYLIASQNCLSFRKPDGGCLGCPATILLFCIVNALGVCLSGDTVTIDGRSQKIKEREPFRILNHECFGLGLSQKEIKLLEHSYRNRLAHNAIIDIGSFLLPQSDNPPFLFKSGQVGIRVFSFHKLVAQAYSQFPKERIESWAERFQNSK